MTDKTKEPLKLREEDALMFLAVYSQRFMPPKGRMRFTEDNDLSDVSIRQFFGGTLPGEEPDEEAYLKGHGKLIRKLAAQEDTSLEGLVVYLAKNAPKVPGEERSAKFLADEKIIETNGVIINKHFRFHAFKRGHVSFEGRKKYFNTNQEITAYHHSLLRKFSNGMSLSYVTGSQAQQRLLAEGQKIFENVKTLKADKSFKVDAKNLADDGRLKLRQEDALILLHTLSYNYTAGGMSLDDAVEKLAFIRDISLPSLLLMIVRCAPKMPEEFRHPRIKALEETIDNGGGVVIDDTAPFLLFEPGKIKGVDKEFMTRMEQMKYISENTMLVGSTGTPPVNESLVVKGQRFLDCIVREKNWQTFGDNCFSFNPEPPAIWLPGQGWKYN